MSLETSFGAIYLFHVYILWEERYFCVESGRGTQSITSDRAGTLAPVLVLVTAAHISCISK